MRKIQHLWQTHRLALIAFLAVTILAGFFAVRTMMHVIYWHDPRHQNQAIEGWMTLGYIARSYNVSPRELGDAVGFTRQSEGGRSLEAIAHTRQVDLAALIAEIELAVAAVRAAQSQ